MKYEKSCGALIIDEAENNYTILLIQHKAGHWSFPKGHIECGEDESMTAIREIKEETDLSVELNTDFRECVEYSPKKDVLKTVVYFLAHTKNKNCHPQLSEINATRWFPFEEAEKLITYPNDKQVFAKMITYLKAKHN